jgi:GNAT superfamily N-acetyltransferase
VTPGLCIEVRPAAPDGLAEPLTLLEALLRNGEPVPLQFVQQLKVAVERGDLEVLVAWAQPGVELVEVAVVAFRPNLSAGAPFGSIEELYVSQDARHQGVGRALLDAVGERCRARGVSYVEVQADDEAAVFYKASGYEPE